MTAIWTTSPPCCWNSTAERRRAGSTTGSFRYAAESRCPCQRRCSCASPRRASSVSSTCSTTTQSLLSSLTVSFTHWRSSVLDIVFPSNKRAVWKNNRLERCVVVLGKKWFAGRELCSMPVGSNEVQSRSTHHRSCAALY